MSAKHRLVVIGDSLSQGFMSGAIHRPDISWPALVARALGIDGFRYSEFEGQGGLPLNLEIVLRRLSEAYGVRINWWEVAPAFIRIRGILDDIEDYWERGRGTWPIPTRLINENLAVWGFEVGDADTVTEGVCRRAIPTPEDNLLKQIPEHSMYRTARRVLNPSHANESMEWHQVRNARELAADGGIENLVVWLGANNALGTVTSLTVKYSEPPDLYRMPHERAANLYLPEHFETLYLRVLEGVEQIGARRVFLGTVPHVTIPPVTRGVSPDGTRDDGYFEYYTRPWVWDDAFDRDRHAHLARQDARRIDSFIDGYNEVIRREAKKRRGWHLFDACRMLDDVAFRRSFGQPGYQFPTGLVDALRRRPDLSYLVDDDGSVRLDTRFLMCGENGRTRLRKGGLFSLDGIHPTTIGYGLIADLVLRTMRKSARMKVPDGPDWDAVVAADTLVNAPPTLLVDLKNALTFLDRRGLLSSLIESM